MHVLRQLQRLIISAKAHTEMQLTSDRVAKLTRYGSVTQGGAEVAQLTFSLS